MSAALAYISGRDAVAPTNLIHHLGDFADRNSLQIHFCYGEVESPVNSEGGERVCVLGGCGEGHQGFTHHVARFERYHALPQFIQPGTLQQRFRIYRHLRLSKKSLGHMCLNSASVIYKLAKAFNWSKMNEMSEELMSVDSVASVVSPRALAMTTEIDIPDIQRGLVWNPTQIAELWKSIFEGYPIGALTVYSQEDKWQLIDGQQRWHAIKLGLHPDEKQKAMTILWTVWEKKQDESWNFVHLMVSTRRHPWGFVWNKTDDHLERLSHPKMIEAWNKMLPNEVRNDSFELPTLAAAQNYFLKDNNTHKWIPLHELLSEEHTTNDNVIEAIRSSEQVAAWRERVDSAFIPLIRFNLQENVKADRNRIHELFTRINKGGTPISSVDYTYSTLCSYLGQKFKDSINEIAENFMPPNRVARLYARLKYAEDEEKRTSGILLEPPHASYWNDKEYDPEIGDAICGAIRYAKEMYSQIGIPQTVYLQSRGDEWLTVVIRCIRRFPDIIKKGVNKEKDLLCMLPYVVCRDPGYHAKFCERFDEALNYDEALKNAEPKSLIEMLAIGVAYAACFSIETGMYPVSSPKKPTIMREYPYEDEWLHVLCNPNNEPLLHFLQKSYMSKMLKEECGFYPHETATWGEAMNRPWDIDHIVPRSRWWLLQPEELMFREALPNKQILYYRSNREKQDAYIGVPADDDISPDKDFCYSGAVQSETETKPRKKYYGWKGANVFGERPGRLTTKTENDNKEKYNESLQAYKDVVNSRFSAMVERLFKELPLKELIQAINALPESAPCCLQLPIELWRHLEGRDDLTWCSVRHDQSKQQIIATKDFYHSLCHWLAVGKEENNAFRCVCWHLSDAKTLHVKIGQRRCPNQTVSEWRDGTPSGIRRNDWWVEASFSSITSEQIEQKLDDICAKK